MRDLRALVRYVYGLTGLDPAYPPRGTTLMTLLMGPGGVRLAQSGELPPGCPAKLQEADPPRPDGLLPLSGEWEVVFRAKLRSVQRDEYVCHEGGELLAIQVRYREEDRERFANELGWALQAPDAAIQRLFAEHGFNLVLIGEELGLSDLAVAVRVAQACSFPTLLATPEGITTVGESVWQTDDTLAVHQGLHEGVLPKHILLIALRSVRRHYVLFALSAA